MGVDMSTPIQMVIYYNITQLIAQTNYKWRGML